MLDFDFYIRWSYAGGTVIELPLTSILLWGGIITKPYRDGSCTIYLLDTDLNVIDSHFV